MWGSTLRNQIDAQIATRIFGHAGKPLKNPPLAAGRGRQKPVGGDVQDHKEGREGGRDRGF